MWKNEKFTLIEKIFHDINSFVNSLVKMLLSRNFRRKMGESGFLQFPHCGKHPTVGSFPINGRITQKILTIVMQQA